MTSIEEKAYAKINISLDVTGKRPDGYHDMLMVMQTITLCDDLTVTLTADGISRAECNLRFVPGDERNLAVRAANAFFAAAGIKDTGAYIKMHKHIPVGAGMAGGSSDAAAVLRALNTLCRTHFDVPALEEIASGVGSDVAFCVAGGTQLASGRGEILSPLPQMPDCFVVVSKPDFSVSTPELFKKLDSVKLHCHPDTQGIIESLGREDLPNIARRMYNVFEDVPDRRHNEIAAIKNAMLDAGALGAVMTGTGSAVFGLFDDEHAAEQTAGKLRRVRKNTFPARIMPRIEGKINERI